MPSTNTTPNLGLNSWIASDRPKRTDFVSDNTIIDTVLGTHIADTDLHLTNTEKNLVSEPYKVNILYGNGNASTTLRPGFTPKLVLICKIGAPFCEYTANYTKVNAAVVTSRGSSGGASITGDSVEVTQNSAASNGILYNLNENNANYLVISFR